MTRKKIGPREAARQRGISMQAIYALIWTGKLRAEKKDGRWWIDVRDLQKSTRQRRRRQPAAIAI
jgi:hypothetical protein